MAKMQEKKNHAPSLGKKTKRVAVPIRPGFETNKRYNSVENGDIYKRRILVLFFNHITGVPIVQTVRTESTRMMQMARATILRN